MTTSTNPDAGLVELLRERVREATAAHLDADPEARESEFYRLLVRLYDVIDTEPASPAAQAVARALLGADVEPDTADDPCEAWRPMVQNILDGHLGQEAAAAVTHLVMQLADTRGQVQALERELSARPPDVAERHDEWCVFLGDHDPNGDVARITTETQGQAEDALAMLLRTHASHRLGVARATVTRGPWRVVTTEGDEQS